MGILAVLFGPTMAQASTGCSDLAQSPPRESLSIELFHNLLDHQSRENVGFSPFSLETALTVLFEGAHGKTREQLGRALQVRDGCDLRRRSKPYGDRVIFQSATSLWARPSITFDQDFLTRVQGCCDAVVLPLSEVQPAKSINMWVAKRTEGKIQEIITTVARETVVVLVNAAYLHAPWTIPFDKADTSDGDFVLASKKRKTVSMMTRIGVFDYIEADGFQAVRVPYGNGSLVMDLLLSGEGTNLADFVHILARISLGQSRYKHHSLVGRVTIPRFRIQSEANLKQGLSGYGLGLLFDLHGADFSRMMGTSGQIALDDVRHKIFIAVDEVGTEAAAATAVTIVGALPQPKVSFDFRLNRPFLLSIHDTTGGDILFLAAIQEPTSGN
ncbi:MAG: hypothetical protein JNK03_10350 [Nitrospira sp.]|jgi:serpin B|nr:hypothetical protein [Nitrospira sp.]